VVPSIAKRKRGRWQQSKALFPLGAVTLAKRFASGGNAPSAGNA
jgi:hypothetical protein